MEAELGPRRQQTKNQFGPSTAILETANRAFELLIMCKNKHDGLQCLLLLAVLHQTDRYITFVAASMANTQAMATGSTPLTPITPQSLESALPPASCQQPAQPGLLEKPLDSAQRDLVTRTYLLLAAISSELLVEDGGFYSESGLELEFLRSRVHQLKHKFKAQLGSSL